MINSLKFFLFLSRRYAKAEKLANNCASTLSNYGEMICRRRFDDVKLENYEIKVHEFDEIHKCNVRHHNGGQTYEVIIPNKADEYGS